MLLLLAIHYSLGIILLLFYLFSFMFLDSFFIFLELIFFTSLEELIMIYKPKRPVAGMMTDQVYRFVVPSRFLYGAN